MTERSYPVINKKAFIYMFDKTTAAQVLVGQFEEWSMNDQLNTLQYRESGYLTPLLIPLDFTFMGYLTKGKLNHTLISQLWSPEGESDVDLSSAMGYWVPKKSTVKLVLQFSDAATEEVTEYQNCVFFSHRTNNARGLVEESVSFMAEGMTSKTQALVADRSPESA